MWLGQDFKVASQVELARGQIPANSTTRKNFIKIFPYSYFKISWRPMLLEPVIAFNLKDLQL